MNVSEDAGAGLSPIADSPSQLRQLRRWLRLNVDAERISSSSAAFS